MGGEDEMELISDLPEGLRRDIKRFLCLDLIKKVPERTTREYEEIQTDLASIPIISAILDVTFQMLGLRDKLACCDVVGNAVT